MESAAVVDHPQAINAAPIELGGALAEWRRRELHGKFRDEWRDPFRDDFYVAGLCPGGLEVIKSHLTRTQNVEAMVVRPGPPLASLASRSSANANGESAGTTRSSGSDCNSAGAADTPCRGAPCQKHFCASPRGLDVQTARLSIPRRLAIWRTIVRGNNVALLGASKLITVCAGLGRRRTG